MFSEFIGFLLLLHLAPVGIGVCRPIRDTIINWCQVSFLVICPFPPISHDSQTVENILIKLANWTEGGGGGYEGQQEMELLGRFYYTDLLPTLTSTLLHQLQLCKRQIYNFVQFRFLTFIEQSLAAWMIRKSSIDFSRQIWRRRKNMSEQTSGFFPPQDKIQILYYIRCPHNCDSKYSIFYVTIVKYQNPILAKSAW